MAMLALGVVGAAIGGGIGGTVLGMSAATVGFMVGSTVGGLIDRRLMGPEERMVTGPRLGELTVQVSTYGRTLPVIYAGRVAGNVIWASDKREVRQVTTQEAGGGGKGGGSAKLSSESYHYYVSLAVSLCEGPIAGIRRIWADGTLIHDVAVHGDEVDGLAVHLGTETQMPDPVIEAHQGAGNVPGYRSQAYVVFDNFYLNDYGGRIPSFSFDVVGSLTAGWGEDYAQGIAEGGDGDVWLVANLQRTVTRLDGELRPKAVVGRDDAAAYLGTLKAQPWRICREPASGHLFVTALGDACVQRIDPATDAVVATIPVDIYPHEIVADGQGGVWVSHPLTDRISRIDAATNAVASVAVAGQPYAFCLDGGGRLWISCTDALVHFDPAGRQQLARIGLAPKWLPCGLAYNAGDGKVWFACSGNDVIGVVSPTTYALSWRNSGTWPAYVACHPGDPRHTVFASMLHGNRVKLLRRAADGGLDEYMEYKTEVWPGPLLARADGRCLASNTNRPFVQEVEA